MLGAFAAWRHTSEYFWNLKKHSLTSVFLISKFFIRMYFTLRIYFICIHFISTPMHPHSYTLQMEAARSSEKFIKIYLTTLRHITEHSNPSRESNLISLHFSKEITPPPKPVYRLAECAAPETRWYDVTVSVRQFKPVPAPGGPSHFAIWRCNYRKLYAALEGWGRLIFTQLYPLVVTLSCTNRAELKDH